MDLYGGGRDVDRKHIIVAPAHGDAATLPADLIWGVARAGPRTSPTQIAWLQTSEGATS
jgi:hypothetical protein